MDADRSERQLIKGPLRLAKKKLTSTSYSQSPVMKSETEALFRTLEKQGPAFKELPSMIKLPQPFVNPPDALNNTNR